jgi:type IV secretory pathway VirD2 relaxase
MTAISNALRPVPLFDISSYARRGPESRLRLSQRELALIGRTVRRTPEVIVKVLTRGGGGLKAVGAHLDYIGRDGELAIETDDGRTVEGPEAVAELVEDWDLDVADSRRNGALKPRDDARTPKLVHKIVFSMPAGTPPKKVLGAVRDLAREEFGAKYRYALALHTDEPHPHVHLVVKAVSEQGERLNIRKATLRAWRQSFAEQLRRQGIAANATERAVRGEYAKAQRDGVYRTAARRESRHLNFGKPRNPDPPASLVGTRQQVQAGWEAVTAQLAAEGHGDLAWYTRRFIEAFPPLRTEQELRAKDGREAKEPLVRRVERTR